MNVKLLLIATLALTGIEVASAKASINDMQTCQGLLDFIEQKLDSVPDSYAKSDVDKVRKGLKLYNAYIQNEIVTPGLLQFNAGNSDKAKAMQKQVDAYKSTLVKSYQQRYPQAKLVTDHAVAVNNCAKKSVPSGSSLTALKESLETMVKLSQQN